MSGWLIKDSNDNVRFTVPAATVIPAERGDRHLLHRVRGCQPGADGDSARLFHGATLVDGFTWGPAAATTFSRCAGGRGSSDVGPKVLPNVCLAVTSLAG